MEKIKGTTVELDILEQGKIALVTLNRPEVLNTLNTQLAMDLGKVVDHMKDDETIRAVILTGKGRAFCAGGDLEEFSGAADPKQFLRDLVDIVHKNILKARLMNAPWIAAINGPCFGVGLSLACSCDFRVASEKAKFRVAFTGVGLTPDSSLPYYLPRIVGLTKATEMIMLNDVLSAEEALKIGLLNKVTEQEKVEDDSLSLARKLAEMPTFALGMDKKMLDFCFCQTLEAHLDLERECLGESGGTGDFQEGCRAFFERRKPDFKGR
ncbi:MAG: enoyl-CoA hydratase/isomerase family protein [Pseudomonadota bacterium]